MSSIKPAAVTVAPRYAIGNVVEFQDVEYRRYAKIEAVNAEIDWKPGSVIRRVIKYRVLSYWVEEENIRRVVSEV